MDKSQKILSDITIFNKYAKYVPETERRETWEELVERNMVMHIRKYPKLKQRVELWAAMPETGEVCRCLNNDCSDTECIDTMAEDFLGYTCVDSEDYAHLNEWIVVVISRCKQFTSTEW